MTAMQQKKFQHLIEKGLDFSKTGLAQQAVDCFIAAAEINPELPVHALSSLGNQHVNLENYREAGNIFEKLITKFPGSPEGYIGKALVSTKQKNWQEAVNQWSLALEKFPEKRQAFWYIHQAQALIELGLHQKAKENYAHCIEAYPDIVYVYTGMAKVATLEKQYEEALKYWNISFSRFPSEAKQTWYNQKKQVLTKLERFAELQEFELSGFKSEPAQVYVNRLREKLRQPKPHKLNFRHILIITYGRTGSTLLQGILNTIGGVVVRGENGNVFYDLFQLHKKFVEYKEKYKFSALPIQPWFGIGFSNPKLLMEHYQNLAKAILATETYKNSDELCFGFKEIRYDEITDDLEPYLEFLKQLFPNPAFIFLTRKLEDVAKSAWWKDQDKNSVMEKLAGLELQFSNYAAKNENCFEITYNDIVTIGSGLKELFTFLGADYQRGIIESALQVPHSFAPEQKHIQVLFDNTDSFD